MIICEGPDCSGKTTLAKHISNILEIEYRRPPYLSSTMGPTDREIVEWWKKEFQYALKHAGPPRVYDRCFYISECIYQPMIPNRPLMLDGMDMMRGIHDLWLIDPLIVFCLPPWEVQAGALARDEDKLIGVDIEGLKKIAWVYWCWWAVWQELADTYVYDYTLPGSLEHLETKATQKVVYLERRSQSSAN